MSDVFDTGRRRARTESAEEPAPNASQSQEIRAAVRRELRPWKRRAVAALASIAATLCGGALAYRRSWEEATEQRGVDRQRLLTVERDLADIRAQLLALFPFLLNPPARPPAPTGDDR